MGKLLDFEGEVVGATALAVKIAVKGHGEPVWMPRIVLDDAYTKRPKHDNFPLDVGDVIDFTLTESWAAEKDLI